MLWTKETLRATVAQARGCGQPFWLDLGGFTRQSEVSNLRSQLAAIISPEKDVVLQTLRQVRFSGA